MEIKSYIAAGLKNNSPRLQYQLWKHSKDLWPHYIKNKNQYHKNILAQCKDFLQVGGQKAVYDCGGMYFKNIDKNIDVIEHEHCPICKLDIVLASNVTKQYDALFSINPLSIKYQNSVCAWLTQHQTSKSGKKPPVLDFVKKSGKVHLVFDSRLLYYNRLKYTTQEFLDHDLQNINCKINTQGHVVNIDIYNTTC